MTGPYPGDMTGGDRHFSGEWYCDRCGEPQDGKDKGTPHPLRSDEYLCDSCVWEMKDNGEWPYEEEEEV